MPEVYDARHDEVIFVPEAEPEKKDPAEPTPSGEQSPENEMPQENKPRKRLSLPAILLIGISVIAVILLAARFLLPLVTFGKQQTLIHGEVTGGEPDREYWENPTDPPSRDQGGEPAAIPEERKTATVTIIDVGQGSCALIESNGEYVMIDTGDTDHAQVPVAFLKNRGITKLKYVIATHWDNDHCAATVGLYRNFDCGPLIGAGYEADTRTYQSIRRMIDGGVEFIVPKPGDVFTCGLLDIIVNGPVRYDYEEENSNSLSMIVTDGTTKIYIGGDTTTESESDILKTGANVDCEVYVCNHHGSNTSSSEAFLLALTPNETVISCGKDNEFGHPAQRVLNALKATGTSLYRTDIQGDIVISLYGSDGYSFEKEPCDDWMPGVLRIQ